MILKTTRWYATIIAYRKEVKTMASETMEKSKEYLEKEDRWDIALGLASVDGGRPSDFLLELIEREKRGEITTDDIRHELDKVYKVTAKAS
jgi:hypothetical protein